MMSTHKQAFLGGFDGDYEGVFVEIQLPDYPDVEIIYNSRANFERKQKYYSKAYNDNLEMKRNKEIKIVKYTFE